MDIYIVEEKSVLLRDHVEQIFLYSGLYRKL